MKQRIIILGAGRMAKAIVFDLHTDFNLTIADQSVENLNWFKSKYNLQTIRLDVTDAEKLQSAIAPFDLVIGAITGQFGYAMLQTVLEAGKPIVDISFSPEDMLQLNDLAKANKTTALVDFGVAPGLSNLVLGHEVSKRKIDHFTCQVGGLPVTRKWPFQYKAPFSPIDVIEEYTRPARIMRQGKRLTVPALSEVEELNIQNLPQLESFLSDGLRSVLFTVDVPNMEEKTIRYPGHAELMQVFKDTGLFDETPINVNGIQVAPRDVTAAKLLPQWAYTKPEDEFTVMTLDFKQGDAIKTYLLLDFNDKETGLSSMARTTGLTCAAAARLYLAGLWNEHGVFAPEQVGKNKACYTFVLDVLKTHNIELNITKNELD